MHPPGAPSPRGRDGMQPVNTQPPRPPNRPPPGGISQASPRGPSPMRGRVHSAGRATSRGTSPSLPNIPGLDFWVHDHACMSTRELEEYIAFNMRNTHISEIYADDYYYQAYLHKNFHGHNTRNFRPQKLFALAPHEREGAPDAAHAKVDGLGKFVYASLRTPRQLLAVNARHNRRKSLHRTPFPENIAEALGPKGSAGSTAGGPPSTCGAAPPPSTSALGDRCTLQTDRMVAARKVMEDCNCALLDVDDTDRTMAAQAAAAADGEAVPERAALYLLDRRQLLMDNIAAVLRVDAAAADSDGDGDDKADGIFRLLLGTHKGRSLTARVLARVRSARSSPRLHGLGMLLAVLRNARTLFGDNIAPPPSHEFAIPDDALLIRAATAVAAAGAGALQQVRDAEHVLQCFQALASADVVGEMKAEGAVAAEQLGVNGLMPFLLLEHTCAPDDDAAWFGTLVIALFDAGARCGVQHGNTAAAFRTAFASVFARIMVHLRALIGLLDKARATHVEAAASSVRGLAAASVLTAMLQLCTPDEEAELVQPLQVIVG